MHHTWLCVINSVYQGVRKKVSECLYGMYVSELTNDGRGK